LEEIVNNSEALCEYLKKMIIGTLKLEGVTVQGIDSSAPFRKPESATKSSRLPIPSRSRDGEGGPMHADNYYLKSSESAFICVQKGVLKQSS